MIRQLVACTVFASAVLYLLYGTEPSCSPQNYLGTVNQEHYAQVCTTALR